MRRVRKAGGIVVRFEKGERRYLLVTAKKHPGHWVFPKGKIERGESPEEAAVREVQEEAAVAARVVGPAGTIESSVNGENVRIDYFWMIYAGKAHGGEGRTVRWCSLDDALARLTLPSSRKLLKPARKLQHKR